MLAFVVALLAYVYFATAGQLERDAEAAADLEFSSLERAYAEGGKRRLNQEIVERSARQGGFLYILAEADGEVITGDFRRLPIELGEAQQRADFEFQRERGDGQVVRARALGRAGRLLGGPILLVASDLGENAAIVERITRVLFTVAVLGFALSVVSGLFASGQAARRAEALSETAREVMDGNLSKRAPISGGGDEFDALAQDFNAMMDRIERLVHTTRTAGDAIAHDLRSPLTRLQQRLDAALEAAPNAEADRVALRKAMDETERIIDTFAAILKLARVESAANWRLDTVDVTRVVWELVEFYEPVAEAANLAIGADISEGLRLRGDEGLIAQAVSNLIENALKYTPAGGRIEVRAREGGEHYVRVSVLDDGPGVSVEDRERIVERFVRLESARNTQGVGLGLALVVAVARLHNGRLEFGEGIGPPGPEPGLEATLVLRRRPERAAERAGAP
jgi:signal transduction histidine kinase